ncbi:2976_t:CDS:2, partial [Acaulospora colombiana]
RYKHDPELYDSIARQGSKVLYFAKSLNENETWVPLIEKAFAKFYGNYSYINWGTAMEAVEDLTGGTSTVFMLKDHLNKAKLWEGLVRKDQRDKLYAVSYLQTSKTKTYQGLYLSHAYSVLRAAEYNGKKFVVIRNPWGNTEWKGAWGDGSKEWTKEWLPALDVLEHSFGDDVSDFMKQWRYLDSTRLFDSNWVVSNLWVAMNGLSLNHPWTWGDVSFIVLQQLDRRSFREISSTIKYDFDFVVFKKGSKRVYAKSAYNFFGNRSRNAEVDLEPGDYVVHDYLNESLESKDSRRLKRIMSRKIAAYSKAISEDIDTKVPIDLDVLAGEDLNEIEIKLVQTKRETTQSRKKSQAEAKKSHEQEIAEERKANAEAKNKEKTPHDVSHSILMHPVPVKSEEEKNKEAGKATHNGIGCDGCGMSPV